MAHISKFIYVLIIFLFMFLVITDGGGPRKPMFAPFPCGINSDCFNKACYRPLIPKCISFNCGCVARKHQHLYD
ncbi:unnamed protein product [Trifolium pratense]|uniref:Uncharacterized protein n=1 Tax=Trifolium pratense TaxID=57577 RepID=A0ACB0J6M7_TRIPR|nr:unnamed protein product [Trifolium pratense]